MQFVNKYGLRVEYNDDDTVNLYTKTSGESEGINGVMMAIFIIAFLALGCFVYVSYRIKIARLERDQTAFMRIYNEIYKENNEVVDTQTLR